MQLHDCLPPLAVDHMHGMASMQTPFLSLTLLYPPCPPPLPLSPCRLAKVDDITEAALRALSRVQVRAHAEWGRGRWPPA